MLCKHCGNIYSFRHTGYCEDCYQSLIAENARLQLKIKILEDKLKYKPKHMQEDENHIPNLY